MTRRGRHVFWDPAFFDGAGLLFGLVVGGVFAARFFAASPGRALLFGLTVTVVGIGVVGGATTVSRYKALPRDPLIADRNVELEFELRLPASRDNAAEWPTRGEMGSGRGNVTEVLLPQNAMRMREGRIILTNRMRLRQAVSPRLLSFADHQGLWVNFMLPLQEIPTEADVVWTDWMPAVNSESGLPETEAFQIRYRVTFAPGG